MTTAVRGVSQVWTIETDSEAEALAVWYDVKNSTCCDFLHWNDGVERNGVCFLIDRDDVGKMKKVAKLTESEFKKGAGVK